MRYLVSEDVTLREDLARAAGARLERPEPARAPGARERRMAGGADRGVRRAARELGIDMPLEALVSLVMTFNIGIIVERLGRRRTGHAELLDWIDAMAVELTAPAGASRPARATPTSRATSSATACGSSTRSTASGEPTVLLLPTWSIVHSRHWKMQIPYLARHCRVVTFDGRGNGRSDRPAERGGVRRARVRRRRARRDGRDRDRARRDRRRSRSARSGRCCLRPSTRSASTAPSSSGRLSRRRLTAARADGSTTWTTSSTPTRAGRSTTATTGCATTADFLEFFFSQMFTEPHSTKPIEDCVGWGLETDAETLVATQRGARPRPGRVTARSADGFAARCS